MLCKLTLEQICTMTESPLFDRKSARIDAKTLAIHLIAFANADGGVIAVGVEDDGTITGIDGYQEHINELLRVPFDYCKPSVQIETELLACTNRDGEPDYILLIEVLQSNELHANQADDVFFRVGDKSKKLNFDERLQLMYAKGTRYFEDAPVPDAAMEDIDLDFVQGIRRNSATGKARRNTCGRTKNLSPPKVARKKSALPPCCCSARIRNTIFPAHASALSGTRVRKPRSVRR